MQEDDLSADSNNELHEAFKKVTDMSSILQQVDIQYLHAVIL